MRKLKFAFISLTTFVFLAMLLSTPLRFVHAQKYTDGGSGSPITYPATNSQYFGTLGSISSAHAAMPPLTLFAYLNPCCFKILVAILAR